MSEIITPEVLGRLIRSRREDKGMTQKELGLATNAGPRFIGELEAGKATCHIGKALAVAASLGIKLVVQSSERSGDGPSDAGYDLPEV